jgi:glycosyltransferase involved in cell wall biosynthesis
LDNFIYPQDTVRITPAPSRQIVFFIAVSRDYEQIIGRLIDCYKAFVMKVALVHDYLTQKGGAERVFELLCKYFHTADIYTSLYDPKHTIDLGERLVNTTVLQSIPGAKQHFRLLAPFYFPVFRALDLQNYDLIISSSSSFAKAVQKRQGAKHICFCHNVTRFLWDTKTYLKNYGHYKSFYPVIEKIFQAMREVDRVYAQEPDLYIANSSTVANRIQKVYSKPALVINYPIDSHNFTFSDHKDDYYLVSSRLLSYKRIDIVIEAFNWLGWPLLVIGDGPERESLESKALSNIRFLGYRSDAERCELMANARSVIVAGLEDYGLVPVEANVSGTPTIAYGAGGVLDTQIPGQTGVFFKQQTPESLHAALIEASKISWDYAKIRNHALIHFSEEAFFSKVEQIMEEVCAKKSATWLNPLVQH